MSENIKSTVVVIIPFYNGAKWIERAILSVCKQTVQPDELIVVNDGSSAEEKEALYKLAERYPFRIINKLNGGQGSARNVGVAGSKSQYISFLDQDDFYLSNHIEDLLAALPEKDLRFGFVYADLCEADGEGNIVNSNMLKQWSGSHPKRGHISTLVGSDMFVLPSASLIKREAFETVGGFDEQFMGYEDDDLFLRLFRAGFTNYFLDKPVTVWCIHANSTSWSIKMSRSRFKYFKKLILCFPDDPVRQVFYFKDCLMWRFGPCFVRDVIDAIKKNSHDRKEICQILCEYTEIVSKHPNVFWMQKCRINFLTFILTKFPVKMLQFCQFFFKILASRNIG